jgi:hypothetical protein
MEQPKVGPKGEGLGMTESNGTDIHGLGTTKDTNQHEREQARGYAWTSQAGAEFSNPFTSELARDCENTSPSRSRERPCFVALCARSRKCQELASRKSTGPAWLAGMTGFLKRYLQARLRGDLQKSRSIREANLLRDFSAIRVNR